MYTMLTFLLKDGVSDEGGLNLPVTTMNLIMTFILGCKRTGKCRWGGSWENMRRKTDEMIRPLDKPDS